LTANVFDQVAMLTLMMLVGGFLRKTGIITDTVNRGLASILINITLPFMIVFSFNFEFSAEVFERGAQIFGYSMAIHAALLGLGTVLYWRFDGPRKNVLKFATVFSNCGFMGYPVIQGLFGSIGVFYTSIYTIPFNLFIFSFGVMMFTGQRDLKSIRRSLLANPPLISTLVGIAVFVLSIPIPAAIHNTLGMVGNMTTPISMFIIGAMLADVKLGDVFKGIDVYYVSALKLIVLPALAYLVLSLWGVDRTVLYICVILVAMPTASLIGVFAEKYDGDRLLASRCAFLTTVLSMITIPGVISNL